MKNRFNQRAEIRLVSGEVDFGHAAGGEETTATVAVLAPWASSASRVICHPSTCHTADHDPDDPVAEGLQAYATEIDPGIGFTIACYAPNGTWGRYKISALGV